MKALCWLLLVSVVCAPLQCLADGPASSLDTLQQTSDAADVFALDYDSDSLSAALELKLGGAMLRMHVANPLELPEDSLLLGSDWDGETPLAWALNGLEVDIGNERVLGLELVFRW